MKQIWKYDCSFCEENIRDKTAWDSKDFYTLYQVFLGNEMPVYTATATEEMGVFNITHPTAQQFCCLSC